ncbi:MAG: NAD-dependent epimerase/dehydratase family protein [Candidatus Omnitrophica bacterium]|nr:NAD-dependent epimerase/dehydratase family protein [Candidatus Omnitrophota bacterium]
MKILVTGGTGFIGRHFVRRALAGGHSVSCMVRETSDVRGLESEKVHLVHASIEDQTAVRRAVALASPDAVVHSAALVRSSDEKELDRVNAVGTRNICEASLACDVKRVIHISSIAVVGGHQMPLTDSMSPKPGNAYGRSKMEAERIVLEYRRKGLASVILRPCMVIGEGEPHAMDVLCRLVDKRWLLLPDIPEADSKLHLVNVRNLADIMEKSLYGDAGLEGTYIIADRRAMTIRHFVEIVYEELDRGAVPVMSWGVVRCLSLVPAFRNRIKRIFRDRIYDISAARNLLGYDPGFSTEEAVRNAARSWKEKNSRLKKIRSRT